MKIQINKRSKFLASLLALLLPLTLLSTTESASAKPTISASADQPGSSTQAFINGQKVGAESMQCV